MDSFFQSLVTAPLFVLYELLFLIGFRPQFNAKVRAEVAREIAKFKYELLMCHCLFEGFLILYIIYDVIVTLSIYLDFRHTTKTRKSL